MRACGPRETVEPLKKRTGTKIDHEIADKDCRILASNLLMDGAYSDKRVVVCWHHGQIPALMHALGAKEGDYPSAWNPDVFNLILKVDFRGGGGLEVAQVEEPF